MLIVLWFTTCCMTIYWVTYGIKLVWFWLFIWRFGVRLSAATSRALHMYNIVLSIRINSLYGSPPSFVDFDCKTATFGPELQASIGTRPHLSFCACKTAWVAPEILVSMGSSPHLSFCALKTATLEPKLHGYMGPRLHLWFFACKTECPALELLVPMGSAHICGFSMQNRDLWTRITSLYGSQTSPVVLWMQNSVISIRLTCLYVFQPSSVVVC